MGGNNFYTNAEAYAFEILQQRLMREAQRSAQQTIVELSALKSFLGQGQLVYCIPLGGVTFPGCPAPLPYCPVPCLPPPDPACLPLPSPPPPPPPPPLPEAHRTPAAPQQPPCPSAPTAPACPNPSSPAHPHQSIVRVNLKNPQVKVVRNKPGTDECNLGRDGIDVTIDLRDYLPAEISLDVEEKSVEVKASHVDSHGCKTFARRYDLPACIILDSVRCVLSHDGFLMFSAAWCRME